MTAVTIVEKVWGHEEWIVNTPQYCGKRLILNRGWQCSVHFHPVKDETFYVQRGRVQLEVDHVITNLRPGDSVRIPPGTPHRFTGLEDSVIFEFSTHHDDNDVVRLDPSRRVEWLT